MTQRRVVIHPSGRSAYDRLKFAPGVWSGNLLLCSGVIGTDASGRVPDDLEAEFRHAWEGVGRVLEAAELGYADIIEMTTYHVGLRATLPTFIKVKDEFIHEPWPAWTAVGISELALPGAHLEIRVCAARNAGNE